MTRLNRCRRISGSRTETRRRAPGTAIATAVAASIAVLAIGGASSVAPIGAAFAQTAGTTGPISSDTWFTTEESVDLSTGGIQKLRDAAQARAQGNCPKGTFTVVVRKGDPLFQKAFADARGNSMLQILGDQARNFVFKTDINGAKNDVRLDYGAPRDDISPTLDVTWTPPKNSKVKAHDRITAKVIARDDANLWQSGIKTIDLDVQGGGSFGFEDYPQPPQTCESPPPARHLEGVYTVPANPPPVVRLHAIAKDYAGNETDVWAEFPTGDWHGTIKKTAKGGGHNHTINIDYAFEVERSGTLKGSARARITTEGNEVPGCTLLWTYSPTEFEIPLGGRRDGEEFEIALEPGTTTATIRSIAGGCLTGGGQTSNTFPSHLNPAVHPQIKYRIPARDGATDTIPHQTGALPWGVVMHDTIHLHQARQ